MKPLIFLLITFFSTLVYANNSFQTFGSIRSSFTPNPFPVKDETFPIKISSGIIYLSKSTGYLPKKSAKFSPGFQLCLDYKKPGSRLDYCAIYRNWNAYKSHHYKIPIFNTTRKIQTKEDIKVLEANIGRTLSPFSNTTITPLIGAEWIRNSTVITINNRTTIVNLRHCIGPLIGFKVRQKIHRYFTIQSKVSLSYIDYHYQRSINQTFVLSKNFYHLSSKAGVYFEASLPLSKGTIRIKSGYEIQYDWLKDQYNTLSWDSPITLRGATIQISMSF